MSWKHSLLLDISRPLFSIKVPNPISYRSQGEYLIQAADVHFFSRVMVKLSRSSTLLVSINQATSAVASGAALVLGVEPKTQHSGTKDMYLRTEHVKKF